MQSILRTSQRKCLESAGLARSFVDSPNKKMSPDIINNANMSMLQDRNEIAVGETIPEGLRYEAGQKSSVVTGRSTVRFYPTSGMQIDSKTNKVTIFRLSSSSFLDPRTATLHFRLSVPDWRIMPEDLLQSLIQSITLQVGGVEVSHIDNFGEAYKMMAYAACPKHVYDHGWNANSGSYKYRQGKRLNMYYGADHDGTSIFDVDTTTGAIVGQTMDHTSHPMFEHENEYYTTWGDGKKGKWCTLPLAELLGFFKISQLIPTPFLGSLDITINWAAFEKACLVTTGYVRNATTGLVTVNGAAAVTAENSKYDIEDLTISCDMVDLDRTYVSLLSGLVSSSPQGIVMPYEDVNTSTRSFTNGGSNSIYISKGVSYLNKLFWGLRCQAHVNNPYVDKSQFKFADAFRGGSYQIEIGSKLYPENRVQDTATAFLELTKAVDSIQNYDQGGLINNENYHGVVNGALTSAPYAPAAAVTAAQRHGFREQPQAFICAANLEKALGSSGVRSGLSLKLSGYSIHLQLALRTQSTIVDAAEKARKDVNHALYDQQMNLLTVMQHSKALVLRADAVSVSE